MDLFNKKKIQKLEQAVESLTEELETMHNNVSNMDGNYQEYFSDFKERLDDVEENMDDYKRYREEKEMLKNGDEPWVDFESKVVDDDGRVEVKMDWNSAFIDYLKKTGFKGSAEEMVSTYFASLVREAGDELTEEQAEKYMNNE